MNKYKFSILLFLLFSSSSFAEDLGTEFDKAKLNATHPSMKEELDGTLEVGEYEIISPNGSITRALCPYGCEDRGIPKEFCKIWTSTKRKQECYVQDLRLKSEAIKIN